MNLNFKIFLVFIFLIWGLHYSFAQNKYKIEIGKSDCDKKLDDALTLYNNGLYIESEKLLQEINNSKCDLNKVRRQDAYELLIKNQLELDKVYQADTTAKSMLENYPHYELKEANNSEDYNRLIKKFDVHPMFTIGARNSTLHPTFKIKETFSVDHGVDYNSPYLANYNTGYITEYYGWLEYQWNHNFSINMEGEFNGFNYYRNLSKGDSWKLLYSESMKFLEIPVYVKCYLPLSKNFTSYVAMGGGWLRMLQATGYANLNYSIYYNNIPTFYNSTDNNIDVINMRNKNSFEAIAEAAIGYKLRNLKIFLYARYFKGLTSLTNSAHRLDNPLLLNTYSYIDNSIILNKYEFGATISFVLKNSIKKTK